MALSAFGFDPRLLIVHVVDKAILLITTMAKGVRYLGSWIEVAPALLICPNKLPVSPVLETIIEEEAEECNEDS
ncbi:hypothetical protein CFP56_029486 [Quercus suber]|uniref:Uncharacterized protein n=1 Tax=Quercus suber TaxID=58331 RepID=A0AAW0JRG9_QUESU